MELREALTQISEIRLQMARSQMFRGYRAAPVAFSGLLAVGAAGLQAFWIPEPAHQITAYLSLWVGAAVISAVAAGAGMAARRRNPDPTCGRQATRQAVEQFLPCVVAGGLLTLVLAASAPEVLWMLPGLWQVLFSLGIFASCRMLPRATSWVAMFYLAAGLACLTLARGESAFSPWAMGIPFGVGQLLAASVLYWTLERGDG